MALRRQRAPYKAQGERTSLILDSDDADELSTIYSDSGAASSKSDSLQRHNTSQPPTSTDSGYSHLHNSESETSFTALMEAGNRNSRGSSSGSGSASGSASSRGARPRQPSKQGIYQVAAPRKTAERASVGFTLPPADYDEQEEYDVPPPRPGGAMALFDVNVEVEDTPSEYETPVKSPSATTATSAAAAPALKRPLRKDDDISQLPNLNNDSILSVLSSRYKDGVIHTYIGDILMVVNPYRTLPGEYSPAVQQAYVTAPGRQHAPPHVYWPATRALRDLTRHARDQCILVSGESGAGKTESTKHMIQQLTHACRSHPDTADLHTRINKVNPLLEAFGNACTIMNRNSSRFGKYIELYFARDGNLTGACIHDYLLERSRVVRQGDGEQNFHIFYYLFAGMPQEKNRYYHIGEPESYRILTQGQEKTAVFKNDQYRHYCKKMFDEMKEILQQVSFDDSDDQDGIWRVLSAVLHLMNVEFAYEEDVDGAMILNDTEVDTVAEMLCVEGRELSTHLICLTASIRDQEDVLALKDVAAAVESRNALAKALYSRLFGWIVKRINENLTSGTMHGDLSIGLLDLSGFENFPDNSLEQLSINMANEQLQNFFNNHIFKEEQEQYNQEGIDWKHISFKNNDGILQTFLYGGLNLFTLLDEETRVPQGSDRSLLTKWSVHCRPDDSAAAADNLVSFDEAALAFTVRHYADDVTYSAEHFLEKNRDKLDANLKAAMVKSLNPFISDLFSAEETDTGGISKTRSQIRSGSVKHIMFHRSLSHGQKASVSKETIRGKLKGKRSKAHIPTKDKVLNTVTKHFKSSLKELLEKLSRADPTFVRCLKPNEAQAPGSFLASLVMRQLKYNGVLEVARVRRRGFPIRLPFEDFVKEFRYLTFPHNTIVPTTGESCQSILSTVIPGVAPGADFAIGRTKVFLKDGAYDNVTNIMKNKAAVCIQALARVYMARRVAARLREQRAAAEEEERKRQQQTNNNDVILRNNTESSQASPDDDRVSRYSDRPLPTPPSEEAEDGKPPLHDGLLNETGAENDDRVSVKDEKAGSSAGSESDEDWDFDEARLAEQGRPLWDMFQLIPRERVSASESYEGMLKLLRALMFLLLFLVVWGSATASIGCLLLLESSLIKGIGPEVGPHARATAATAENQLMYIIMLPMFLTFVVAVFKVLFGNYPWPSWRQWIGIIVVEVLHTVGVVLLVYRGFVYFGALYGLGLMNSVCLVPALLKLIFLPRKHAGAKQTCVSVILVFLDFLALLLQLAAVGFPVVVRALELGQYRWPMYDSHADTDADSGAEAEIPQEFKFSNDYVHMYWQIPLGLVLTSVQWWENFVGKDRGVFRLVAVKKAFHDVRVAANVVVSVVKVLVVLLVRFSLCWSSGSDTCQVSTNMFIPVDSSYTDNSSFLAGNNTLEQVETVFLDLTPMLGQMIASLICWYAAALACKLLMQKFSFALPLLLATPTMAGLVVLQCYHYIPPIPALNGITFEFLCDFGEANWGWYTASAALWWLSCLWISRYVWFPEADRLAMTDALFVQCFYSGPLVVQSMLLNRRSNDHEMCVKTTADGSAAVFVGLPGLNDPTKAGSPSGESLPASTVGGAGGSLGRKARRPVPMVYACATMWHETRSEMMNLLKSIFRMDQDQSARRIAQDIFKVVDPDYYEFEAHILFDDCMELNDNEDWVLNSFVKELLNVISEAQSSVLEIEREMPPPAKVVTPFGGRLIWKLPGGNNLIVQLKDKNKIRHRKRWSQVMYMYYLLGYRLVVEGSQYLFETLGRDKDVKSPKKGKDKNWKRAAEKKYHRSMEHYGKSSIFKTGGGLSEPLVQQAENTFILALDGDVDFKPDAVRLLVDRMKINEKTGAACGRIHPIGAGPMVWYQIFEYAVGHWFQKATEHVLGCVLCSPGCFSLFRGSALMDDNVMRKYTIKPQQASDYLQYDQGEDRWLCTLLLQQGYRIDYTAASDALTFAPETFNEFFNQRRRWTPSTMANVMDLLSDAANTVRINPNISYLYILYQFFLMVSTIIGPATIVIAIASALETVFNLQVWESYLLSVAPVAFYIVVCFKCKTSTQLLVGAFLSTAYAAIMTVVLVGIMTGLATKSVVDPSLLFLVVVAAAFIFAGIIHPYELGCLVHGIMYFLCIPAGYLILMIYSLCNMHVVSWGTREVPKRKTAEQIEQEQKEAAKREEEKRKKNSGIWSYFRAPDRIVAELKETLTQIFSSSKNDANLEGIQKLLRKLIKEQKKTNRRMLGREEESSSSEDEKVQKPVQDTAPAVPTPAGAAAVSAPVTKAQPVVDVADEKVEDPTNPAWVQDPDLKGERDYLSDDELKFWEDFIKRYLKPLKKNVEKEKKAAAELLSLRDNASFGFWLINILWVLFNFVLQGRAELTWELGTGWTTNPVGFVFLIFFLGVLLLQIVGMVIHRWGTFLQLIAITEIPSPLRQRTHTDLFSAEGGGSDKPRITAQDAIEVTRALQKFAEPPPDYDYEDEEFKEPGAGEYEDLPPEGTETLRKKGWCDRDLAVAVGTIKQEMQKQRARLPPGADPPPPPPAAAGFTNHGFTEDIVRDDSRWRGPRDPHLTIGRRFQRHNQPRLDLLLAPPAGDHGNGHVVSGRHGYRPPPPGLRQRRGHTTLRHDPRGDLRHGSAPRYHPHQLPDLGGFRRPRAYTQGDEFERQVHRQLNRFMHHM